MLLLDKNSFKSHLIEPNNVFLPALNIKSEIIEHSVNAMDRTIDGVQNMHGFLLLGNTQYLN